MHVRGRGPGRKQLNARAHADLLGRPPPPAQPVPIRQGEHLPVLVRRADAGADDGPDARADASDGLTDEVPDAPTDELPHALAHAAHASAHAHDLRQQHQHRRHAVELHVRRCGTRAQDALRRHEAPSFDRQCGLVRGLLQRAVHPVSRRYRLAPPSPGCDEHQVLVRPADAGADAVPDARTDAADAGADEVPDAVPDHVPHALAHAAHAAAAAHAGAHAGNMRQQHQQIPYGAFGLRVRQPDAHAPVDNCSAPPPPLHW